MVYQVNSNVAALNVYNNLSVHQAKSSASLARISSGLKAAGGDHDRHDGHHATQQEYNIPVDCENGKTGIVKAVILPGYDHHDGAHHGELGAMEAVNRFCKYPDKSDGKDDS